MANEHYKTPGAFKAALTRALFSVDYYIPQGDYFKFYFKRTIKPTEKQEIKAKFAHRLKNLFFLQQRHMWGHTVTCLIAEL